MSSTRPPQCRKATRNKVVAVLAAWRGLSQRPPRACPCPSALVAALAGIVFVDSDNVNYAKHRWGWGLGTRGWESMYRPTLPGRDSVFGRLAKYRRLFTVQTVTRHAQPHLTDFTRICVHIFTPPATRLRPTLPSLRVQPDYPEGAARRQGSLQCTLGHVRWHRVRRRVDRSGRVRCRLARGGRRRTAVRESDLENAIRRGPAGGAPPPAPVGLLRARVPARPLTPAACVPRRRASPPARSRCARKAASAPGSRPL